MREQFAKLGIQPSPMKPEEFARFVRSEIEVYKRIVSRPGSSRSSRNEEEEPCNR